MEWIDSTELYRDRNPVRANQDHRPGHAHHFDPARDNTVRFIVLHRISLAHAGPPVCPRPVPDADLNGSAIAAAFSHRQMMTGGCIPYHLLIRFGHWAPMVEQLLPLSYVAMHARGFNRRSIGIAIAGNYDEVLCPPAMHLGAELLCKAIVSAAGKHLRVVGHTDLPGASGDPNKRCPGRYFSVGSITQAIEDWMNPHPHSPRDVEVNRLSSKLVF